MPELQPSTLRVDPDKIRSMISTYENAANRVYSILTDLNRRGRIEVPWAADRVSVEMTSHYNAQVFDGEYSTYAAIKKYESELRAVTRTLRDILAGYERTEAEAEAAVLAAGRPGGGS
ncbi:WXG100 family type VII secretion target [Pseudonocardia humida]|uniref:PE family protein n=1 Tax=Pseudonocardia humida TaxID=2800819 RepID=A0ABT1ACE5_9PSEU|nr:hypothetical protein [Pseudonocardia humida]MCO1660730.1 hypothetical protein [Pseudonocardia humida]